MADQDQDGSEGNAGRKGRRPNPWGQSEGRPQSPWGSRPGGQDDGPPPPDLQDLLRRAQENFGNVFPDGNSFRLIGLGVAVLVALWLLSGFYFIQPNEHAVVLTFGEYTRTEDQPGLKYRFPAPVQSTTIVPVTAERRLQIGFRDTSRSGGGTSAGQTISDESLMLTGDENIVDINFVVLWRIGNAKDYLFSIRDPESTIHLVAQSAIREIIGRTRIQSALTEARGQIQDDTRKLMQSILDDYKSGVVINNVQLQKVDPPADVVDAFNEVQRARQEKERLRNEAEAYRNDIIPRAKGEAEKFRQEADAYKQQIVSKAKGDADRFNKIYEAYRNGKEVTSERMYLETIEQILQNAKVIVMGSEKGSPVIPYMSLDQLQRQSPVPVSSADDASPQTQFSNQR